MKVNPTARIRIMHSARGTQTVEKTWSALGFEWFGPKHPALPTIAMSLHTTGKATYTEDGGTLSMTALDPVFVPTVQA